MIAVCIPSRGLMHSRTMEDVVQNCITKEWCLIMAHGMPQPDAQNYLVEEALKFANIIDYIWFVDDDMQIPLGTLDQLIKLNTDVAVAHYPVAKDQDALHIRNGVFESAGMGCMLIRPSVFEKLERPYFRTNTVYIWENDHLQPYPARTDTEYHGLHDVDFSQRLVKAGYQPGIIDMKLGQYNLLDNQVRKWGNHTNQNVETWRLPA